MFKIYNSSVNVNIIIIIKSFFYGLRLKHFVSCRGQSLDLNMFKEEKLVELRLKSVGGMDLNNFSALKKLTNLKHLVS